ncbi:NADH:flavin oxidoreductase/NADH oxidase [Colletotrichum graminicola]|uniref:NADH:flavin oxidoreductase/NADH oxidase n=1 Tax=Colletotrichum graminicola (strain M1.001 / M2 / FGSC 10212) TaxID=645133 RepID=E3Q9G8_COLGM|nr:NADH:flavin oxidoreductase/NADH oxidase [Colletotrichum graminicola M1.001]EFQ27347.1 NADH:flavin oxidoreductase/NADH oxidase [Colletotrichum graminicola M1.001]WDK13138.1 NADH:flavin oxidoreductase/NADH oxidase [Colletotrichum graminicola]
MSKLFSPLAVGSVHLSNRLALAPLTRYRADDEWTPTPMMKEYYAQRACVPGTLLVSEATIISYRAVSRFNVPGIWTDAHIAGWKQVTDAVHEKGSFIYCQLWHLGRGGKMDVLQSLGLKLESSSAVPIADDTPTPVELSEADILDIIEDYATAARNAIEAGFDGVEIHGANGYLPDQFLQDNCNKRTDAWGGSIEKRARFHLEVTKAVINAVGAHRTAVRLSPYSDFQGMLMDDPDPTFRYLVEQLKPLGLAYLHLIEARISGNEDTDCGGQRTVKWLVELWNNASPVSIAGGLTAESARKAVEETYKQYDVILAFGRCFIPNPDLVFRIREGIELEKYDRTYFYTPKLPTGYIDYPFSPQFKSASSIS